MTTPSRRSPAAAIAAVVALCLVATVMRPAITAVGPLIPAMSADTGIPLAVLGALSTVILLIWTVVSPLTHGLGRRLGLGGAVLAALIVLAVGCVLRSIPGSSLWLWIGTGFIGVALAIGNVLLPAVIKRDFPTRVPLMMGVYSALLGASGAVGSGLAVPLSGVGGGSDWRLSLLLIGGGLVPIAIIAWGLVSRREMRAHRAGGTAAGGLAGIWRDPTAWAVAGYMGVQSTVFYVLVTWLAAVSASTGRSATVAGLDVSVFQLVSLIGALGIALLMRGRGARLTPALTPVVGLIGIVGLIVAPAAVGFWVIPLGLFSGSSLGISLTLMAERARDHRAASALSGMSQSVGYAIAAIGPLLFGVLHTATGGWTASLLILVVTMLAQIVIGVFAARDRYVLDPR
ncbi:MFS transporter [Microbacterium gorillae]|uniref:MFS transporter n=1 Tax=Microbacterium gorillae TaxID=1231063 RepID=UPI000A910B08|nr:MFS transporter [Microbacterium gorillae]